MHLIFGIATLGLLCVAVNSQKACRVIPDTTQYGTVTVDAVKGVADDVHNVTRNIKEYIKNVRHYLLTETIPDDGLFYYLFTPEDVENPYNITTRTKGMFKTLPYDNKKSLVFGIHGYDPAANLESGFFAELVRAVTLLNKYNVIFVDYSVLNRDLLSVVIPKVFNAAKNFASFLRFVMEETGTTPDQLYLIGASSGGQIASQIGKYLPGIGRITALDPGGAFLDLFPIDLRLDRGDAKFVTAMHTSDGFEFPKGWGYYPPCGHLDFYVNGGLIQPGCNSTVPPSVYPTTIEENIARLCGHARTLNYYVESMCNNCTFVGTMCESYEKFKQGKCNSLNSVTAVMGEFSKKPPIDLPVNAMFFLDTNSRTPFCIPHQNQLSIGVNAHANALGVNAQANANVRL